MTRASPSIKESTVPGELQARPGLSSRTGDPIDSWLNLLTTLLRLPASKSAEIRDELEDHIRTRVRDQLVEGVDESTAVRRAIEEVGEASGVAHRFRAAQRTPARRILMHLSVIAIGAGALGLSVASLTNAGHRSQPAVYQEQSVGVAELESISIDTNPEWTFSEFAHELGKAAGRPVYIHWLSLQDIDVLRDDDGWSLDVDIDGASVQTVLRLLNERIGWDHAVAFRVFEERLEFATGEYFDKQSVKLVRYDVADIVEAVSERWTNDFDSAREEIIDLIQSYVEPNYWVANGGALASTAGVGDQLFIEAPERLFPKIEWLMEQLRIGNDIGDARAPVEQVIENAGADQNTQTIRYTLAHTDAQDVATLVRLMFFTEEPRPSCRSEPRTNSLIIRTTAQLEPHVDRLLEMVDTPADPANLWHDRLKMIHDAGKPTSSGQTYPESFNIVYLAMNDPLVTSFRQSLPNAPEITSVLDAPR